MVEKDSIEAAWRASRCSLADRSGYPADRASLRVEPAIQWYLLAAKHRLKCDSSLGGHQIAEIPEAEVAWGKGG